MICSIGYLGHCIYTQKYNLSYSYFVIFPTFLCYFINSNIPSTYCSIYFHDDLKVYSNDFFKLKNSDQPIVLSNTCDWVLVHLRCFDLIGRFFRKLSWTKEIGPECT